MERTVPAIVRCANGARPPGSGDRGKEEAQRQIGGFLGQDAGRVGDDNATGKGGIDINIVIAHAKAGDDFGLGQMVEQVFAHPTVQCQVAIPRIRGPTSRRNASLSEASHK
jgi:hypothetical protein